MQLWRESIPQVSTHKDLSIFKTHSIIDGTVYQLGACYENYAHIAILIAVRGIRLYLVHTHGIIILCESHRHNHVQLPLPLRQSA